MTLVKCSFDYTFKELFVTIQPGTTGACKADYSRFDLRRRYERSFAHGKEIFYVIPCLQKH